MDKHWHILIVEDDIRLAELIRDYLQQHNMDVSLEHRGDRAVFRILNDKPDLVILDLMLPGLDGFGVCRRIRPQFAGPVLMLTATDEVTDQVVGLEIGADDYVVKPAAPRVLLARIRSLLRRTGSADASSPAGETRTELRLGTLHIKLDSRSVFLHEQSLALTTSEFELLWLFATHAGNVLSRDKIFATARGIAYDGQDRSVDARVSRLRKKLGDNPNNPTLIKTVRGKGYLLTKESSG